MRSSGSARLAAKQTMFWSGVAMFIAAGCGEAPSPTQSADTLEATATSSALSTSWTNVSLSAPQGKPRWVNANGTTNTPAMRNSGGITVFRGLVSSSTGAINPPFTFTAFPATFTENIISISGGLVADMVFAPGPDATFPQIQQPGFGSNPGPAAITWTSLDGVWFDPSQTGSAPSFQQLALTSNWAGTLGYIGLPSARKIGEMVFLQGAANRIAGTDAYLFTMPSGFVPEADVYMPVSVGSGDKGRLFIRHSDGHAFVWTEGNGQASFIAFTGASYAVGRASATTVTATSNPGLKNGWASQPYATGQVAFRNDNNVIRLQGGVAGGTNTTIFTLPVGMRPATLVHLTADGINGAKARIDVGPAGNVFVSVPDLATAAGFISLDGVSFAL